MNVAARHMIPVEMLAAFTAAVFGLACWQGRGPLWSALHAMQPWGGFGQEAWWGGTLLLLAAILLLIDTLEWFDGRAWGPWMLMFSADVRCAAALLLSVALLSLFGAVVVMGDSVRLFFFATLAPVVCGFLLWSAWMTRRLSVALDDKYVTPAISRATGSAAMGKTESLGAAMDAAVMAGLVLVVKVVLGVAVVLLLSMFGWAISSLHMLAGWTEGGLANRLVIIKGMLASLGGGMLIALGGLSTEMPVVLICIGVFAAGIAGERFLLPFVERILARITAIFEAALGRNGNGNGGGGQKP
jgi:hypothetical protein